MYRWSIVGRQAPDDFSVGPLGQGPLTQELGVGLHRGALVPQSVEPRHCTQLPVVRSQRGLPAGQVASVTHWTQSPTGLQLGVSGSALQIESSVQRAQMCLVVSQKSPRTTQSLSCWQLVAQRRVPGTQTRPAPQSPSTPHSTQRWSAASQRCRLPAAH
jgi:hypothetical protein